MALWPFRSKPAATTLPAEPTEERASLSDPNHWIIRLVDSLNPGGYNIDADGAMKQAAVFACVRVLSETIASLPCVIYERGPNESKDPARNFYLWPILHDSPNNYQTSLEFFEMQVAHICLRGNAYSFIERNQRGQILRLIPLHPDRVNPQLVDPRSQTLAYEITDDQGKKELFSNRDIWHLKALSSDGFIGVSPIQLAKATIGLSSAAENHGVTYYQNGARASGIAKLPGVLKEDAKKRLEGSLNDAMSGTNKFRVLVFEQGMDWVPVGLTNEDSQYLETRNFQVEEIARLFRVPCILIGHPNALSTYASAEQFMMSFVTHTIRPWLVRLEQSANKYLLTDTERSEYFVKFKLDALLRGDTQTRYAAYSSARAAKWMSANEIRQLEDMNPIPGGDTYENPAIDTTAPQEGEESDAEPDETGDGEANL